MATVQIRPRLRVFYGKEIALGPGKMDLLEALAQTGSITQAAKCLGMSYMRAWTLIRTMNRCFRQPLVVATHGGAHGGGGAALTVTGRRALALYRHMEAQSLRAVGPDGRKIKRLLRD
jgi:molybdate transport system regulatory protein